MFGNALDDPTGSRCAYAMGLVTASAHSPMTEPGSVRYKRSRFSTRLPVSRRYTAGHLWLHEQPERVWRIGLTKFALRMLGDPVELDFELAVGASVGTGEVVGWIEGFKAVSDLFAPFAGRFAGGNAALDDNIDLVHGSPYEHGWLFAIQGEPGDDCFDVEGYVGHLDATIDRMLGQGG